MNCWNCDKNPATSDDGVCDSCSREMLYRERVYEALPKAREALDALRRLVDTTAGVEALKRALEQEHRTNQQLVCRAIVAMLEKWNEDACNPGWYDARNEASVQFAKAVFDNVPERLRYFPYI